MPPDFQPDIWAIHAASLDAVAASCGAACPTFQWPAGNPMPAGTGTWKALPGSVTFRRDLAAGGFGLDSDLRMTLTTAQFGAGPFPDSRQNILYNGKIYRIVSVDSAPGGHQITINANDASQNA